MISHVSGTCYSKNKESKKTTSTVNNIVFDRILKRFCMYDVCNLKYVGKLECLSHKPSFLVLFAWDSIWFTWFFVDIYLVALCCLVSVIPNIMWFITFGSFQNIETFHMKCQWWRQKCSAAIASVAIVILVVISVHFTDQNFEVYFWSQFQQGYRSLIFINQSRQNKIKNGGAKQWLRRSHHDNLCQNLRGFFLMFIKLSSYSNLITHMFVISLHVVYFITPFINQLQGLFAKKTTLRSRITGRGGLISGVESKIWVKYNKQGVGISV